MNNRVIQFTKAREWRAIAQKLADRLTEDAAIFTNNARLLRHKSPPAPDGAALNDSIAQEIRALIQDYRDVAAQPTGGSRMKTPGVPSFTLRRTMPRLQEARAALPAVQQEGVDPMISFGRYRAACAALALRLATECGANIAEKSDGTTVIRIHGIRATSTGGLSAALGNWIAAADRELARRQKAGQP